MQLHPLKGCLAPSIDGVRFLRIVYLYAHYQSVYDDPIDHLSISYKNYLLIVCVCANDTDHTTVYHHHHIWKASIGSSLAYMDIHIMDQYIANKTKIHQTYIKCNLSSSMSSGIPIWYYQITWSTTHCT